MNEIDWLMASALADPPVGQLILTASGPWVVPPGVTSISAVAVQAGGSSPGALIQRGAAVLLRAQNGARIGDGGGEGGTVGNSGIVHGTTAAHYQNGGPGAGGYSGNGGDGAWWVPVSFSHRGETAGMGGGGGGGGSSIRWPDAEQPDNLSAGGGVGLYGQGASGEPGLPGSGGTGATYGGCYWNATPIRGGALAWKNSIAVTPGETLAISIGERSHSYSGPGAVRIIWGGDRSFPYNAGDI